MLIDSDGIFTQVENCHVNGLDMFEATMYTLFWASSRATTKLLYASIVIISMSTVISIKQENIHHLFSMLVICFAEKKSTDSQGKFGMSEELNH